MDLIALALALKKAKKYTDNKVQSSCVSDVQVNGTSVVNNGVANFGLIASENGAFGLRYYNGVLQYKNGNNWVTLSLASQTI